MKPHNYTFALLVVGLVNAFAIWWGLSIIAMSIRMQDFNSDSPRQEPTRQVVTLPSSTFAVVQENRLGIYRVDANGQVKRLSDVSTQGRELEPAYPDSTPTPKP